MLSAIFNEYESRLNSIQDRRAQEVKMIRNIGVYTQAEVYQTKKGRMHEFTCTAEQNSSANSVDLDIEGFLGLAGDLAPVASTARARPSRRNDQ